ncbi:MAG: hypothetical protein U0236_21355 [Nitrospira sp.]
MGGVWALFRVKFSKPIPLEDLHLPSGPLAPRFGYQRFDPSGRPVGEREPQVSEKSERFIEELHRLRCLGRRGSDGKLFAVCGIMPWNFLTIIPKTLKKGQNIELIDRHATHVMTHGRNHAVQFVKWVKGVGSSMVVWFPERVNYMEIEDIIDLSAVQSSYITKESFYMPFNGYKALYKAIKKEQEEHGRLIGVKMPPARKSKYAGRPIMVLDPPVPIKQMIGYIRLYHEIQKRDEPELPIKSVWYTLMKTVLFNMAPIKYDSISAIRLMREDNYYAHVIPAKAVMGNL